MRLNASALVVVACLMPQAASAVPAMTGNELLQACTGDTAQQTVCGDYLRALVRPGKGLNDCIPDGTTTGELQDAVVMYLQDHPALRNDDATAHVVKVIKDNWNCP